MQEEPRRARAKIRVGSITFVIPEEDDTLDDHPKLVSVVQQSPVIINRSHDDQAARPQDGNEEWI
jgi:hypothetical protein